MSAHIKSASHAKKSSSGKTKIETAFKAAQKFDLAKSSVPKIAKFETRAPQTDSKTPDAAVVVTNAASMSPREKTFSEQVLSYVPESVRDKLPTWLGGNPVKTTPDIEREVAKRDTQKIDERNDRLLNAVGFTVSAMTLGQLACSTSPEKTNKPVTPATPPPVPTPEVDLQFRPGQGKPVGITPDYGPMAADKELINTLIAGVGKYQPLHKNVFDWPRDNSVFKDTNVSLIIANEKDIPAEIRANLPKDKTGDAFTIAFGNQLHPNISLWLLADKVFYDEKGQPRPDATIRALTALSHELYGNVQTYLESVENKTFEQPIDRKKTEIRAFSAGIHYLERMAASDDYKTFTPKVQNDIKTTIEREKKSLLSWQTTSRY